jgi:hypothetical protein
VNVGRRRSRRSGLLATGLVLVVGGLPLSACSEVEESSSAGYEPAKLEPAKGKGEDAVRVTFTEEGARRTGLQTARVASSGKQGVVPHAALIYDGAGTAYVYTSPERLSYVREQIEVDRIERDRVLLSDGPPAGTEVVTVGAAEVYGAESEIGGGH